jgi:hypothetical protein
MSSPAQATACSPRGPVVEHHGGPLKVQRAFHDSEDTAAARVVSVVLPAEVRPVVMVVVLPALTRTCLRPVLRTMTRAWTLAGSVPEGTPHHRPQKAARPALRRAVTHGRLTNGLS